MISEIKVFAPASVANVSCGFDVLGFCLDPIGDLIHVKMTEKPGVHIGNIKIDPINKVSNSGEYGILIGDRNTWGEGYGYEASKKIINYCFSSLKLSQITLGVKKKNYAAIHLYEKLGFNILKRKGNQDIYQNVSKESIRMFLRND